MLKIEFIIEGQVKHSVLIGESNSQYHPLLKILRAQKKERKSLENSTQSYTQSLDEEPLAHKNLTKSSRSKAIKKPSKRVAPSNALVGGTTQSSASFKTESEPRDAESSENLASNISKRQQKYKQLSFDIPQSNDDDDSSTQQFASLNKRQKHRVAVLHSEEEASEVDDEDEFQSSEEEELVDAKKKKQAKKVPEAEKVDLDSMTKRQRMAYLQKHQPQTLGQSKTTSIQIHGNKKNTTLHQLAQPASDGDHVFYELSNLKPAGNTGAHKRKHAAFIPGNGEEMSDIDEEDCAKKSKQNDEAKRQQLEKILEEQVKRFRDKERKLAQQNVDLMYGSGLVGRYVAQNSRLIQGGIVKKQQPGQFIKLKFVKTGIVKLYLPDKLKDLFSKLKVKKHSIHKKSHKCSVCGKAERKYVNEKGQVSCSFDCFKQLKCAKG